MAHPGTVSHAPAVVLQDYLMGGALRAAFLPGKAESQCAHTKVNSLSKEPIKRTFPFPRNTMAFGCKSGADDCREMKYWECMVCL